MRLLVADDDPLQRRMLSASMARAGYDVVEAHDGRAAWRELLRPDPPALAIIDWLMPGLDGLSLCRRLRSLRLAHYIYVVMLTARGGREDVVAGLEAGADDYIVKPFDPEELRSRLRAGVRIVELESRLAEQVSELERAVSDVETLEGLVPVCMVCNRVHLDEAARERVRSYLARRGLARFTHTVCGGCLEAGRAERAGA